MSCVKEAFKKLGWTIKENSKIRTYPYDPDRDKVYPFIAVNPKNGYDLGLVPNDSGQIEVFGDFFDRSIAEQLGADICKMKQQYACAVIEDEFLFKGYTVDIEAQENGNLEVIATKI